MGSVVLGWVPDNLAQQESADNIGIYLAHNGRANIGFGDGHVASQNAADLHSGPMGVTVTIDGNLIAHSITD